jgi:phenylalanyl-tRNA synthetase beta chain
MDGRVIGSLGVLDPGVAQRHGHDRPLVAAEIELAPDGVAEALSTWPPESTATALPAFPAIDRDLTILIDEPISWAELERAIHTGTPELLESTEFVTVFRGGKLPANRKAITLRLRFRAADRTLRHEEVDPQMTYITARLIDAVGGEIRQ